MKSVTKGIALTAAYFLAVTIFTALNWFDFKMLKLNELGDFFAGVIGPIALLWLVFGYIQQGHELKQGTLALNLQATELKRSVDQQAKMAAAHEVTLRNYDNALEPLLKVDELSGSFHLGDFYCSFSIRNLGEYCERLEVVAVIGGVELPPRSLSPLFSGDSAPMSVEVDPWRSFELIVNYRSRSGRANKQCFSMFAYEHEEDRDAYYVAMKHPFLTV